MEKMARAPKVVFGVRKRWAAAVALACTAVGWAGVLVVEDYRDQRMMNASIRYSSESYAVQEAVQAQRQSAGNMRIIQIEPAMDGVLVLYKRTFETDSFDLQAEYVRWTWRGWQWVWGGGASGSIGVEPEGLFAEYMPSTGSVVRSPFPLAYGVIFRDEIRAVRVADGEGFETTVQPIAVPWDDQRSWYAWIPADAGRELTVSGIGANGEVMTSKAFIRYEYLTEEERSSSGGSAATKANNGG